MKEIFITGTGFWKPNEIITNDEIVNSYNAYVDKFNEDLRLKLLLGKKVNYPTQVLNSLKKHLVSRHGIF